MAEGASIVNLREFLEWWLRGLRATAVNLDEFVTQRRYHARLDAEWERDAAEYEAHIARVRELVNRLLPPVPFNLEALWARPTVTPDRSGYARPSYERVAEVYAWMYEDADRGFDASAPADVRDAAVYWLALRERVTGVRLP